MVHGDDDGLVLPPHVAPVECRIIPIAQHKEGVLDRSYALLDELKKAGYRVKIDDSDKSTGWKFSEQEILGIPTRIEIGPKDIEKNQVVVVRRDNREKIVVSLDEIAVKLREILEQEQQDMYNRAEEFLNSHIDTATTMDEMVEKFKANRGFVKACWCGDPECEGEVKYQTGGAATRCLIEDEEFISDKCIYCGKPAKHMAYWGKSYYIINIAAIICPTLCIIAPLTLTPIYEKLSIFFRTIIVTILSTAPAILNKKLLRLPKSIAVSDILKILIITASLIPNV